MGLDHISASFIDDWLNCPYKAIETRKRETDTSSKFTALGTVVHKTLERYYDCGVVESLFELYDEEWGKADPINYSLYDAGIGMLKNFEEVENLSSSEIVAKEVKFELNLGGPEDRPCIIQGLIDRIDYHGEGVYEIIDYKTSFNAKDKWAAENDIQMAVYALAFWLLWDTGVFFNIEEYPEPKHLLLSLFYLRHGKTRIEEKSQETLVKMANYIRMIWAQALEHEDAPKQKLNPFCAYCLYRNDCAVYQTTLTMLPNFSEVQNMEDDVLFETYKELRMQNGTIEKRLDEVKHEIEHRLLIEDGAIETEDYMVRATNKRYPKRNVDDVRQLLEPKGLFYEVVSINNTRLDKVASEHNLEDEVDALTTYNMSKPMLIVREKTSPIVK